MRPGHLKSVAGGRYTHRECGPELGCAKQEFKEEADINRILARYRMTGVLDQARTPAAFGDDIGYKSYADAHAALEIAKEQFMKLPPEIRLELGNDPGRYKELSSDEDVRRIVERIGHKERSRIAAAQALVAQHAPKPTPPPADPAPQPPKGGTP